MILGLVVLTYGAFGQKHSNTHQDSVANGTEGQDLIGLSSKLLHREDSGSVDRSKASTIFFSVIPVAPAESGEGGKVAISAINASFYLGEGSNMSSIYFYPYTNFKDSYGVVLSPYIWLDKNLSNITGDFRFVKNVVTDYGLGTSSPKIRAATVQYDHVRTYFAAQTHIRKNFYLGGGYFMDYFYNLNQSGQTGDIRTNFASYPVGTGKNVVSSGVTANALGDNRKNSVNPDNGFYYNVIFRLNDKTFGSTYAWQSLYLDGRKYYSFSDTKHKVLAIRGLYWGTYGDVPYLNLPATFQDFNGRAGRGYVNGRFRGKQMLFAEAEYRFDISAHGFLGATIFMNAQSFTESSEKFESIAPAAGVGLRVKFNHHSKTNLALDFAYGRDGFNFNLNLGEYF